MLIKPKFGDEERWNGMKLCQNANCPMQNLNVKYPLELMVKDPEYDFYYCSNECLRTVQGKNMIKLYNYTPSQYAKLNNNKK